MESGEEKLLILENEMEQVKKTLVEHGVRIEKVENSTNDIKFLIQDLKNSVEKNMLEQNHRVERLEELIKQVEQTNRDKWSAYDERKKKEEEREMNNKNSLKMTIVNKLVYGAILIIIGSVFGGKILDFFK
jgi:ribosomal protein L11 methylase PrmA